MPTMAASGRGGPGDGVRELVFHVGDVRVECTFAPGLDRIAESFVDVDVASPSRGGPAPRGVLVVRVAAPERALPVRRGRADCQFGDARGFVSDGRLEIHDALVPNTVRIMLSVVL